MAAQQPGSLPNPSARPPGRTLNFMILGAAAGLFSGLLGIGGAAILVPGMVAIMGLAQHQATGTSLMVIIPTAALSAIVYALNGQVDWLQVLIYSVSSSLGAVLGARLMLRLSPLALRRGFGIFLLVVALRLIAGAAQGSSQGVLAPALPAELGLGLVAGIFSGLLGIGGGQVLVPGMTLLFGVNQQAAQGISLAFIVPTAMAGAITHYHQGTGLPGAALLLVPGSLVGGLLGSSLAQVLPVQVLKIGFACFLIYVGLRMIWPTIYTRLWRMLKFG